MNEEALGVAGDDPFSIELSATSFTVDRGEEGSSTYDGAFSQTSSEAPFTATLADFRVETRSPELGTGSFAANMTIRCEVDGVVETGTWEAGATAWVGDVGTFDVRGHSVTDLAADAASGTLELEGADLLVLDLSAQTEAGCIDYTVDELVGTLCF